MSNVYAYVKQYYGVHPEPGMRVTSEDGKHSGVIIRPRGNEHYVHVRIDGRKHSNVFHPLDLIYQKPADGGRR